MSGKRSSGLFSTPDDAATRTNEEQIKVSDEEKKKRAEQQITDELANQATTEPGSPEENDSKERRAQAEKDHCDARDATSE
jgi:hypothetical protein